MIYPGQSNTISCNRQVGIVVTEAPVSLTAEPLHVADGLSIVDAIIVAKKEANNYFRAPVTNTSDTCITMKKK